MTEATKAPATLSRRVAEASTRDVGRAIARLDPSDLAALGLSIGDSVELRGGRTTVCRVMPTFPNDRGKQCVHIDGVTRENAQIGVDDQIELAPIMCREAISMEFESRSGRVADRDLAHIAQLIDGLPAVAGDRVRVNLFGSGAADFTITKTSPKGAVTIGPETALTLTGKKAPERERSPGLVTYEDIGGLGKQLARIRETIELPVRFPELFERLGIDPPRGVLLHGPPGCGKTLIARAIAHEAQANFFVISGPEIVHKHYGESEAHLRKIWDQASKSAPAIIFIDEIDSIAPKRSSTEGEVEKRIVAQLLALMDGLAGRAGVMVLAATNLPNNIDPALRRPGRFDREVEIPVPDKEGRAQILAVHSLGMPLDDSVDMDRIASITHGCVGADLQALCREAAMRCLRTIMGEIDFGRGVIPYDKLRALRVTNDHFLDAYAEITPSAMREAYVETPDVSWDDVAGLTEAKQRLIEAVEWPLLHADRFEEARLSPPKGILLAGPPGVGKTMLAKATASQAEANFISVKGAELMSRFVGESERALREVFRKARQASPCVIFLDEADALLPRRDGGGADSGVRDRVLGQFLAEMDGVEELRGVLVLAATNRLDIIDPAARRPGRFDLVIQLDLPDQDARAAILQVHMLDRPFEEGLSIDDLVARSAGCSGAQLKSIIDRAAMASIRRAIAEGTDVRISSSDLDVAADEVLMHAQSPGADR